MDRVYLTKPIEEFNRELLKFKEVGEELSTDLEKNGVQNFISLRDEAELWKLNSDNLFKTSFNLQRNRYANILSSGGPNTVLFHNYKKADFNTLIKFVKHRLFQLQYLYYLINVSNSVLNPDMEINKELMPPELINLLLAKLYKLYPNKLFFHMDDLLAGDGIQCPDHITMTEIAGILTDQEFVNQNQYGSRICLKVSTIGYIKIKELMEKEEQQNPKISNAITSKKVFIVHGHDKTARLELEKMLKDDFNLEPIILEEQPSDNFDTIITKLDKHARNCAAAIILYTPDDKAENETRARQNVVLELGYFLGYFELNRRRIILLKKPQVNIPSDLHGVIYLPFNESVEEIFKKLQKQFKHWEMI